MKSFQDNIFWHIIIQRLFLLSVWDMHGHPDSSLLSSLAENKIPVNQLRDADPLCLNICKLENPAVRKDSTYNTKLILISIIGIKLCSNLPHWNHNKNHEGQSRHSIHLETSVGAARHSAGPGEHPWHSYLIASLLTGWDQPKPSVQHLKIDQYNISY